MGMIRMEDVRNIEGASFGMKRERAEGTKSSCGIGITKREESENSTTSAYAIACFLCSTLALAFHEPSAMLYTYPLMGLPIPASSVSFSSSHCRLIFLMCPSPRLFLGPSSLQHDTGRLAFCWAGPSHWQLYGAVGRAAFPQTCSQHSRRARSSGGMGRSIGLSSPLACDLCSFEWMTAQLGVVSWVITDRRVTRVSCLRVRDKNFAPF